MNKKHFHLNKKKRVVLAVAVLALGLFTAACAGLYVRTHEKAATPSDVVSATALADASKRIAHCKGSKGGGEGEVECIFVDLKNALVSGNISSGFDIFDAAYRDFPSFSGTGCHKQAHKVGDLVYYDYYIARGHAVNEITFPQITTSCGYGFFHGFLEHFIQDNPTAKAIGDTCEYLRGRYGREMGDLGQTCYHGSGHGLTLAQAEKVPKDKWGDLASFTVIPLKECDALEHANSSEKEDCKEGVFNVVVNFMVDHNFGFEYPSKKPFAYCEQVPEEDWRACVAEVSQKFDSVSDRDPVKLREIVKEAPNDELASIAFQTGVAGIIQQTVIDGNGYDATLDRCVKLDGVYFTYCAQSVIHGLFEHGEPTIEYKKPLMMCADPRVVNSSFAKRCYADIIVRLPRFYTPERRAIICKEFPTEYQADCK